MKRIKGIVAILFAIIIVFQLPLASFAATKIPEATSDFYVNDFAKVFTDEEKNRLMENAVSLSNDYNGIQVVVTTIESLGGDTIESYATKMYNQYGIGRNDMGILILLATKDRKIRVEVGKAMEAYINDSKAGRFMDKYAIPYLKENKFNEGLISLQENLISEIKSKVETEKNKAVKKEEKASINWGAVLFWILAILVAALVIFLIYLAIKKIKEKKEEIRILREDLNLTSIQLEETTDTLVKERNSHRNALNKAKEEAEYNKDCFESEERRNSNLSEQISSLRSENRNLSSKVSDLEGRCTSLKEELSTTKDRYRRATALYPSLDNDVDNMINEEIKQANMDAARKVDDAVRAVAKLPADKDNVSAFNEVISKYSNLTGDQRKYLKTDIKSVNKRYDESVQLKREYEKKVEEENNKKEAKKASMIILGIISAISVGAASNLDDLKKAKRTYENLSSGARNFFDSSIAEKTNKLLSQAQKDYDEKQRIQKLKDLASDAGSKIKRKISYCSGYASDLSDLEDAMRIYERLDRNVKEYFDKSILRRLQDLIEEAERDKRRKEDEERRRRDSYYSSSSYGSHSSFGDSSFGGGSSFGGFGGSSGGGGASRGF